MLKTAIAALFVVILASHTTQARDYTYEARAAAAAALALQGLVSADDVTPEPAVKTCLCSDNCVCGCNDGGVCDCAGQRSRPTAPAKTSTVRQWYDLGEKLPPGEYRLVGGRYFRVGEPPATISYVQPQQYAIPTQRFSGITYGGSCGPGGCR